METTNITNLCYELWTECRANAEHLHHHRMLRKGSRQRLHFPFQGS